MILQLIIICAILLSLHYILQNISEYYKDVHTMQIDFIKTAFKNKDLTTMSLIMLWGIGAFTILIILLLIANVPTSRIALFSAFAILISAFMASIAMIKSIKQAQSHKEEETKTALRRNILYLHDQANEVASIILEVQKSNLNNYLDPLYELIEKKHAELNNPNITSNLYKELYKKVSEMKRPMTGILLELFKYKGRKHLNTNEADKVMNYMEQTKDGAIDLFTYINKEYKMDFKQ